MKRGFTLSEVLTTLIVIGVVATLTIPIAFQGYTKMTEKAAKEKFIADFNSALENYVNDNFGEMFFADIDFKYLDGFKPYLNIMKDCGTSPGCLPQKGYKISSADYKDFDVSFPASYYKMILSDGNILIFDNGYGLHTTDPDNCHVLVWVDINGERNPNELGRDLFHFTLYSPGYIKENKF